MKKLSLDDRENTGATKSAVTHAVPGDGLIKLIGRKTGPQHICEKRLSIRKLPQHEVADAGLAAGADQQLRVWRVGQAEVGVHRSAQACTMLRTHLAPLALPSAASKPNCLAQHRLPSMMMPMCCGLGWVTRS